MKLFIVFLLLALSTASPVARDATGELTFMDVAQAAVAQFQNHAPPLLLCKVQMHPLTGDVSGVAVDQLKNVTYFAQASESSLVYALSADPYKGFGNISQLAGDILPTGCLPIDLNTVTLSPEDAVNLINSASPRPKPSIDTNFILDIDLLLSNNAAGFSGSPAPEYHFMSGFNESVKGHYFAYVGMDDKIGWGYD